MKPAAFEYHRPDTAADAVALLSELGDDAKVLAGGQSLVPMLNLRLAVFEHLVDISRIPELEGIERRGDSLWIGAGTTEAAAERSSLVTETVPLLARSLPYIGHFQIRNRGTVGGSIAHADPAAELPAVAVALDATIEVLGPQGARSIPAAEFFTGLWSSALEPEELLTGVSFPIWSGRCGFAVQEFARRHGDFAMAGAVVALELDGSGSVARSGIGLIGMGTVPERASASEAAAAGKAASEIDAEEIGRLAVEGLDSIPSDMHGSAAYRSRVGAAMVSRAWTAATKEALDV